MEGKALWGRMTPSERADIGRRRTLYRSLFAVLTLAAAGLLFSSEWQGRVVSFVIALPTLIAWVVQCYQVSTKLHYIQREVELGYRG